MKAVGAIATTQAAQTFIITPTTVFGASLATGLIWLLFGVTGTAHRVANLVKRPVVLGISCSNIGGQQSRGSGNISLATVRGWLWHFLAIRHFWRRFRTLTFSHACPRSH
jgi:hypothetical protein